MIKCYRCGALYTPSTRWVYGRWTYGTTDEFIAHGHVKAGHCPICRKPPQTDKPAPEYIGGM